MGLGWFGKRAKNATQEEKQTDPTTLWITVASHVGLVRSRNEDNYYVQTIGCRKQEEQVACGKASLGSWRIFAVLDGMGGEAYGAEASRIAARVLHQCCKKIRKLDAGTIEAFVYDYIQRANAQICRMIQQKQCHRSGCTLALVALYNQMAYVFNVGDSRVYHYTPDGITQLTQDQTLAMQKQIANIYTEEEAKNSPDAHKITSYLGVDTQGVGVPYLAYPPVPFTQGKLLLCSDGLTDLCSDDEIAQVLSADADNDAEELVYAAIAQGGRDNITCVVLQY